MVVAIVVVVVVVENMLKTRRTKWKDVFQRMKVCVSEVLRYTKLVSFNRLSTAGANSIKQLKTLILTVVEKNLIHLLDPGLNDALYIVDNSRISARANHRVDQHFSRYL